MSFTSGFLAVCLSLPLNGAWMCYPTPSLPAEAVVHVLQQHGGLFTTCYRLGQSSGIINTIAPCRCAMTAPPNLLFKRMDGNPAHLKALEATAES